MPTAPPLARWDAVWYRSIAVDGYRLRPGRARRTTSASIRCTPSPPAPSPGSCTRPSLRPASSFAAVPRGSAAADRRPLRGVGWSRDGRPSASPRFSSIRRRSSSRPSTPSPSSSCSRRRASGARAAGRWILAGVAGFAACLTRLNGFPAGAGDRRRGDRGAARRAAPRLAVRPGRGRSRATLAGAAVYPAYLWRRWGDPLLYVHSKAAGWAQHPGAGLGSGPQHRTTDCRRTPARAGRRAASSCCSRRSPRRSSSSP